MKKISVILTAFLIVSSIMAQSPEIFNYQAIVRDANGNIIADSQISMRISLLKGGEAGKIVCEEVFTPTTNTFGLITLAIGSTDSLDFFAIDWSSGPYFIKVELDPSGGINYTEMGTSQLISVPYALYAEKAETITGTIPETDPVFISNFDLNGAIIGDLLQYNGTKWVKVTPNYLTSFTETQALDDVLTQGNDGNSLQIKNIADPTEAKDAVTKAYVDALKGRIATLEDILIDAGLYTLKDERDSSNYKVVQIGNQLWMAENLRYLPFVALSSTGSTTTPYYYVLNYEGTDVNAAKATTNYSTYGVLYNWPAAMNNTSSSESNPSMVQGVCPNGWHLPSDAEWKQLTDYLGGIEFAGGKLKEAEFTHWNFPNTGATNETGFTALPGGWRYYGGTFTGYDYYGYWWSATEYTSDLAWYRVLSYNFAAIVENWEGKGLGFSVRCLKD
jgi:uncharacterized protein (TIGR02145 family)